jgi:hypothetical protein
MFHLLNTQAMETERVKQQSPLALGEKERLPPEPRAISAGFCSTVREEWG